MHKLRTVRELISKLQECDLDSTIWVSTDGEDPELDRDAYVIGIVFDDDDSEEAKEVGYKKYGTSYLRVPVLVVEKN